MRVTGLFAQRNYNIESLTVARTLDPALSRMTCGRRRPEDPAAGDQADQQADQRAAGDRPDRSPSVARELVLLRIRAQMENRTAILKEAEIFGARVVDSSVDGFALEATGEPEKLDEFINVMASYGDIQVTRSGLIAVSLEMKKLKLAPARFRPASTRTALKQSSAAALA